MRKKELNISRTFKVSSAVTALASAAILGVSSFGLIPTKAFDERAFCVEASRIDDPSIRTTNCQAPVPSVSPSPTVSVSSSPSATPTVTAPAPSTPAPSTVSPSPSNGAGNGFSSLSFSTPTTSSVISVAHLSVSSDGSKMFSSGKDGWLYTSSDSGTTWIKLTTPNTSIRKNVAISGDGKSILAPTISYFDRTGPIWASKDFGLTWSKTAPSGGSWASVSMTPDGRNMFVANDYGYGYYYSTDGGATWNNKNIPKPSGDTVNRYIMRIDSSDDAKKILVGDDKNLFLSTDGGTTWKNFPQLSGHQWRSVSVSGDGKTLLAAGADTTGFIATSTDDGATWMIQDQLGGAWGDTAMSYDGTKIVISKNSGSIFTSIDTGKNWIERKPVSSGQWLDVDILPDGTKIYAADNNTGKLYVGTYGP